MGGAATVLAAMSACRADVILSGHFHRTHIGRSALQRSGTGWASLQLQAGTATSTRLRGQPPSFNVLLICEGTIELECYTWSNEKIGSSTTRQLYSCADRSDGRKAAK